MSVILGLNPSPVIVEEVWDELTAPKTTKPAILTRAQEIASNRSHFDVRSILVGSPVESTYQTLRAAAKSPRNRGEDASIALAAHDSDLVFVTSDVAGSFRALAELPGRVLALHTFLRHLHDRHEVPKAALAVAGTQPSVPAPTWWTAWIATP